MQVQAKHRFSVRDYYRMAETGVLAPDARVELLDGEIIDMSPIGPFHAGVTIFLNQLFSTAAKGRWTTIVQSPVALADDSEPQPDVMLAKPAADCYRNRHPRAEDVFLLIEIADSSVETDRTQKLPAYGRAGIPEVWIIDLNELAIEVYREPDFNGYSLKTVLRSGQTARPQAFPDVSVPVAELLAR